MVEATENGPKNEAQRLYDRVVARADELKLPLRYFSMEATGKPDMIRDMKRGRMPRPDKLHALAEVMRTNVDVLLGRRDPPSSAPTPPQPRVREAPATFAPPPADADIPILGTALGSDLDVDTEGDGNVSVQLIMLAETQEIGRMRRLPGLLGKRDIYALYVRGSSMEPRYYVGEAVYVDPHKPASAGDDVIVQLRHDDGEHTEMTASLIKRLVRQTRDFLELQQHNPPLVFRIAIADVGQVHRIVPLAELAMI